MRYRIVDVFSERPLAGNALCVVLDPCPADLMQAVAREVKLSETTFPVVTADHAYRMRIFTPDDELPFAGHPSIGTAWTLGPQQWEQTTSGAVVTIDADAHGAIMSQPDPELTELDDSHVQAAVAALGLDGADSVWCSVAGGTRHVLVPTSTSLSDLQPDLAAVRTAAAAAGGMSLCPFRRIDDHTLHVRVFVPSAGIAEDPGTGSAAGPIGVLARELWNTSADIEIRQGDEINRPCRIEVHAEPGAIRVGGKVALCAEGLFTLD